MTLDSAHPRPMAEFWAAMLGGKVVFTTAQAVGVRAEHMWLSAIHVDGYRPPTWPDDTRSPSRSISTSTWKTQARP